MGTTDTTATTGAPKDSATSTTSPTPTAATSRRFSILFWIATAATAIPLLATRYPPFTDLPEHVAAIATLAKLLPGGGGAPYVVAFGSSQYFLYHAVGAILTRVVGDAILAHGILLATVAFLWPLSLRSLLRAFERDERLAIFGCMVVWNRALLIGFLPFVASVPLALFGLALVVRQTRSPTWRRGVLIGLLAIAIFYTHVSSFTVFVFVTVAIVAIRRRWVAAAPILPSLYFAVTWWRAGALENGTGQLDSNRLPLATNIAALPVWTFEIWRSHVDDFCAVIWWASFGAIVVSTLKSKVSSKAAFALVPFACSVLLYLVIPIQYGTAGYVNLRLAPVLVLFSVLALEPPKGRAGDLPIIAAAVAALVTAGNAMFEMRRLADEELGDIGALLARAKPGSRLVTLSYETTSKRMPLWPYVFVGSYHRVNGGAIAGYSFTELSHWPLHYAPGTAPPIRAPFWIYGPCAYRYRSDGTFYDYVLVHGRVEPFTEDAPGPRFVPVARARAFTLYEKTGDPPNDAGPDRGPCPR